MKNFILYLFLLPQLALTLPHCNKQFPEFGAAAPLPADYVYVPKEVRERFYQHNDGLHYWGSWIREYPWATFYINLNSDTESYPQDTAAYKINGMDKKAKDLFWLLFYDQLNNKKFLDTFQMYITQSFRWEPGEPYRRTYSATYRLNDSLFIK